MADDSEIIKIMLKWQSTFDEHVKDEMVRYKEILQTIQHNYLATKARYESLDAKIDKLSDDLKEHSDKVKNLHGEVSTQLHQAIPDKDFAGHGQLFIREKDAKKEREAVTLETKKKVFSGTVAGGLLIIGYALLEYIKHWMQKP